MTLLLGFSKSAKVIPVIVKYIYFLTNRRLCGEVQREEYEDDARTAVSVVSGPGQCSFQDR